MTTIGKHTRLNTLADIPAESWIGYYWLSHEPEPHILAAESPVDLAEFESDAGPANPFVAEANLYCPDKKLSLSIRHVDGAYRIDLVDWTAEGDGEIEEIALLGHSAFGGRKLRFKQTWIPKADPLCTDMNVLVPAWMGFVGYTEIGE